MTQGEGITHLLWTGGWDSTYRLLQLVVIKKKTVQTHYVVDPSRRSIGEELHSMSLIKQAMFKRFPETRARMCPTIITDLSDVPSDAEIAETDKRVLELQVLGTQYAWLARYAKYKGVHGMEMGINRGHNPGILIDPYLTTEGEGYDEIAWVDERHKDTDAYTIFGAFRFPLRTITKPQMGERCKEQGVFDILDLIWFCHYPRPNHTACGMCSACSFAMTNGLQDRIPLIGRISYYIAPVKIKERLMTQYYLLTGTGANKMGRQGTV